ncbi:UMP kinase [bacterium]|nr:UMP kinase [bacterium]
MRYKRVLLKLSGEAISGDQDSGFDPGALEHIADEVLDLHARGVEVSIVIGGGNIFRGTLASQWGIERAEADNIGTMGTVINSLMLRGVLTSKSDGKVDIRVMSAIPINTVAEPFIRLRAIHHLEKKYIVIFAAGIGNPYVTTDYTSAQRAIETRSEALLFAKNQVAGIYTADPRTQPSAKLYRRIHYNTIIKENLTIVDQSSVLLARDHKMPMHFFDFSDHGMMLRICRGEEPGTLVTDEGKEVIE